MEIFLIKKAFAQSATGTMNEGFGGISGQLRDALDAVWAIGDGFDWLGCMIQGFFMGFEAIGGCD